jgi:hypothetical protein
MFLTLFYTILKFICYFLWCRYGISYLMLPYSNKWTRGLIFGIIRLLIGALFGTVLGYFILLMVFLSPGDLTRLAIYLTVYVVIRWIEWSLMEVLINKQSRSWLGFWFGNNKKSRIWRAGGIVVSYLADVPLIAILWTIPLGRIFC